MRTSGLIAACFTLGACLACGSSGGSTDSTTGGQAGSGNSSGGGSATGGSPGSGGTSASGGSSASGGTSTSGGSSSSGGTVNTGGTGGAAGPITVTACDGLPQAGQWENITPPEFSTPSNMEMLAVVVDQRDQSVYGAAGNKTNGGNSGTGVYKSTDCGASWTLMTTGQNADKLMSGDPWAMMIDPINPDILYINNGYGNDPTIYKSTNQGVDFVALEPHPVWKEQSHVQAIAMEPGHPAHIAVTFHNTCESPYNGLCLSRSNDGGATWKVFDGPSQLDGWQEAATLAVLGPTSYLYAAGSGAWFTSDEGESWSHPIDEGFAGSYADSSFLASNGKLYLGGAASVYESSSNPIGQSWTALSGSSRSTVIIGDGVSLYASHSWAYGGNPVYTAPLDNLTNWTNMIHSGRGANQLAYDESHHIIYAANWGNGLWRLVTR